MLQIMGHVSAPALILVLLADIALVIAALRLAWTTTYFKSKVLWVLVGVFWPVLVIIFGSSTFRRKWLWLGFDILCPSLQLGALTQRNIISAPIPINITVGGSISIAALVIVCWWIWARDESFETEVSQ